MLTLQRPSREWSRAALVAVLIHASATGAFAQLIEGRPFRALFRTVANPADSKHQVDVSAFFSVGRDEISVSIDESDNLVDPRLSTGTFGSMSLRTHYAHQGRHSDFALDAGLTSRYYSRGTGVSLMNMFGGLNWATDIGDRARFTLSQRVAHSPFHAYGGLAVDVDGLDEPFEPPTDQRVLRLESTSYDTRLGLNYQVGRRSHLGLDYGVRYVDIGQRSDADARDVISHRPRIRFRRELGRYASLNIGYGFRQAEYIDSPFDPVTSHDVNVGVGYSRPLSFSRRTRVGFNTGSTITQAETTNFHVVGSAFLRHALTRTWNTVLAYHRGMDVREGFSAPFFFFSDTVSATLGGRLAGPVSMRASGAYTSGRFTVAQLRNNSDSISASLAVHVPVTTMIAATVQGYYADQQFQRRLGLLTGVPLDTNTYGVRAGLSLWVPVVR